LLLVFIVAASLAAASLNRVSKSLYEETVVPFISNVDNPFEALSLTSL
jgi:hypothetical protein